VREFKNAQFMTVYSITKSIKTTKARRRKLRAFAYHFPDYKDASANAKNSVIPAWMPESRAREGDYPWRPHPI